MTATIDPASTGYSAPHTGVGLDVPLAWIRPNPHNPRKTFDPEKLRELAESIKAHGLLEPLVVRSVTGSGAPSYELLAGERRWRVMLLLVKAQLEAVELGLLSLDEAFMSA